MGGSKERAKIIDKMTSSKIIHFSSFPKKTESDLLESFIPSINEHSILSFTPGSLMAKLGLSNLSDYMRRANLLFVYEQQLDTLLKSIPKRKIHQTDLSAMELPDKLDLFFTWKASLKSPEPLIVAVKSSTSSLHKNLDPPSYLSLGYGKNSIEEIVRPDAPATKRILRQQKDSTGAGDALAAGVMHGILSGVEARNTANFGYVMAALASQKIGARTAHPTYSNFIDHCRNDFAMSI